MYLHKTPFWIRNFFTSYTWKKNCEAKNIYLTFDDGPIPGVTDFVLEQLLLYNAKATFFCVGDNVARYPEIFKRVLADGHRIGNHTFNHLNGWKSVDSHYYNNVLKCQEALEKHTDNQILNLFRPPYGKIKASQLKLLKNFEIVMWDVLSGDFDRSIDPEDCLNKTIKATENGSIIIFHDSLKAEENIRYVLPKYLSHFFDAGYKFLTL